MGYIKKHKLTVFIILVYIIVIGFTYFIYKLFIGSSGLPVYGDRLDGIEKVPITEEQIKKIEDGILSENFVLKVTKPYLNGKILKVVITVGDTASIDASKALTKKVSDVLTAEQKAFYDVEVYVTKPYLCTLEATGKMDEEGNFLEDVVVKFSDDLSKNDYAVEYGLLDKNTKTYNKEQEYKVDKDGAIVIYGYTKDKLGESTCSIKITKKVGEDKNKEAKTDTVNSVTNRTFPIIGYKKYGIDNFVWTK